MTAATTGRKLRGRHSKSNSSTASITEASGALKVAAIPAAAPADQQGLALVGAQVQVLGEDRADRAAGHDDRPLGAERAAGADADRGRDRLEHRDLGPTRLPPIRIASIASGIPCPRIFSEPYRAITPTTSPPTTGAAAPATTGAVRPGGTVRPSGRRRPDW